MSEQESIREEYSILGKMISRLGVLSMESIPGQLLIIFWKSMKVLFKDIRRRKLKIQPIIQQTYFSGIEAIPFIALIAIVLGTITIIQALTVMPKVGFGDFFGNLMVIVINRELGPILTAFIIAGRTGSSLTTYIAYMKVNSEVDALETMGINPYRYLIMPAVIGAMLAVLTCTIVFNAVAIFVGFVVVKLSSLMFVDFLTIQLQWDVYYTSILDAFSWADPIMIVVKPLVFGAIIATSAVFYGMAIKNDIRAVPQSTSKSVVQSFTLIVIADILLSGLYIFEYISKLSGMI